MIKAETLVKGQKLRVNLDKVRDRLPQKLVAQLTIDSYGKLIGYKIVDGNNFGLVLELGNGTTSWFFENELCEIKEEEETNLYK